MSSRADRVADEPPVDDEGGELHVLDEPPPLWSEDGVRAWLTAQGALAHGWVGVTEDDWVYTEAELVSIAGPLSRILNRYDATRAMAGMSDEGAVAMGFGAYVGRNYQERRAALAELRERQEPASGVPAEGPEPEPGGAPFDPVRAEWKTDE